MHVPVNRHQSGMILAQEVRTAEGGLMLAAGASPRAEDIAHLARMQVATVEVVEPSRAFAGKPVRSTDEKGLEL